LPFKESSIESLRRCGRKYRLSRIYLLSLGSQQGNRHIHWHIAPLPPGVPYEEQQLEALRLDKGALPVPDEELASLAWRIRQRMDRLNNAQHM
jgi:hypothetical protein